MPNIGRPSGACFSCKRMKVKCPEERPQCSRCVRANRKCPGYVRKAEWYQFRYEDPASGKKATAEEVKGYVKEAEAVSEEQPFLSDSWPKHTTTFGHELELPELKEEPESRSLSKPADRSNKLPRLLIDWESCALGFFFHTQTSSRNNTHTYAAGLLSCFEDYMTSAHRAPYLNDALRAAALVSIVHRTTLPGVQLNALLYRSRALKALQTALDDDLEARSDNVLATLFLLERFELMSGENQTSRVWSRHSAGISAVLHLRGQQGFHSELGTQLFVWLNSQLLMKDLAYGTTYAFEDPPDWAFLAPIGLHQSKTSIRLAQLERRYRAITAADSSRAQDMMDVAMDVLDLETTMGSLSATLFTNLELLVVENSSAGYGHFDQTYPKTFFVFKSLIDAIAWTVFWSFKMRTTRLLVRCRSSILAWLSETDRLPSEASSTSSLCASADNIASALPFLLGQTDRQGNPNLRDPLERRGSISGSSIAMSACNGLVSMAMLDDERPGLRRWAMRCLLYVGNVFGVKQAHAFHDLLQKRDF